MKKIILLFVSTLTAHLIAQSQIQYLPNTLILKVKPQYRAMCNINQINIPSVQKVFQDIQTHQVIKKFPEQQPPREKYNKWGYPMVDLSLIYEIKYTNNLPIEKVINALKHTDVFEYVEPHYIPQLLYTPNDPSISLQYALTNIQAFSAWNIHKGDTNTVIGITDTGTELTHSDLGSNIKKNYNDPIDGIDNDGDGYIDNFQGWDVGMNDNDPTWQGNPHGVHVNGIAAAATDNGIGIAGVGFQCKFLPVKIADASGNLIASYEGIKYAAEHGCKVINCSWGGPAGGQYGQDIVNYATFNYDALVIAACGNNSQDELFYPAAYDNVLAVASTNSSDVKSSFSNYGYYVGISAPGENIYSTWNSNSYLSSNGTSMASPCVAGAAAIVRSYFPSYNALQIMYRLRQTADNIYGISGNASYQNKLGNGRLNLYRALTNPNAPYVVYQNIQVTDNNDGLFVNGDTLRISGIFKNFLAYGSNITATLSCLSPTFQILPITTTYTIGSLNTLASVNHSLMPFQFKITYPLPPNTPIAFKISISDGTHIWTQFFYIYIYATYLNINVNDVASTATGIGRIGYYGINQAQGLGFAYKGNNLLYEAGLMIGVNPTAVADCVRNASGGASNDFTTISNIMKISSTNTLSDMDTYCKYEANSTVMLGIEIEQRTFAWSTNPNTKFIIWDFTFLNKQSAPWNNFYAGIFADFDIDAATFSNNKCTYHSPTQMGYTYRTSGTPLFAGIKLLTHSVTPIFYGIDNINGGAGGVNLYDGYDKSEKYTTLSTQRLNAGQGTTGNDVIQVMSAGPINLAPGQPFKLAFAIIAGDSLADLINSANQAQTLYDNLPVFVKQHTSPSLSYQIFPNPTNDWLYIISPPSSTKKIEILDVTGKIIYQQVFQEDIITLSTKEWTKGIYFINIVSENSIHHQKIIIQ